MTFYEAALRVLEGEGRPLHVLEITEKSIAQNLLSHVGKMPEQTMLSRLAAMARRTRDRRIVVTAKDTFALSDWSLPEDAEALAQTGLPEPHPEESLPPLRPEERHPEPRIDNVKAAGRNERKRRRDEEDESRGRRRKLPPLTEVAFEVLSETSEPLRPAELVERARKLELVDELSREQLLTALLEDNQRRIDAGRQPQFFLSATGQLSLWQKESSPDAPTTPVMVQAAFAQLLGIPFENGRAVFSKKAIAAGVDTELEAAFRTLKSAAKDARRDAARAFRRKLGELDAPTFERAAVKMLHGLGFRELKVAKRGKEGPLLTARKREGSVELRYAIRLLRGGGPAIDRRLVQELRRDLGHYAAHLGLIASPGEARSDARAEAQGNGAMVFLWCGEAVAEKFFEARAGVRVTSIELYELDEGFFDSMKQEGTELARRREERTRERGASAKAASSLQESGSEAVSPLTGTPGDASITAAEVSGGTANEQKDAKGVDETASSVSSAELGEGEGPESAEDDDSSDGGDEGEEQGDAAATAATDGTPAAERKRRRRRRRGRRGRGPRPDTAPVTVSGAPESPDGSVPSSSAEAPSQEKALEPPGDVARDEG